MTIPGAGSAKAAARLGSIAEILAIVVREVDWKTYDVTSQGIPLNLEAEYNIAHGRSGEMIRYQIRSRLTGKIETTELFRSEIVHEAYFMLPKDDPATDDEIESFGSISVFFMVFPYIRELVHLLTGNSGFPGLLLAPHRLPVDPALVLSQDRPGELQVGSLDVDVGLIAEESS